jgi:hypothetical protein
MAAVIQLGRIELVKGPGRAFCASALTFVGDVIGPEDRFTPFRITI